MENCRYDHKTDLREVKSGGHTWYRMFCGIHNVELESKNANPCNENGNTFACPVSGEILVHLPWQ